MQLQYLKKTEDLQDFDSDEVTLPYRQKQELIRLIGFIRSKIQSKAGVL
jgi:hypothetical protein